MQTFAAISNLTIEEIERVTQVNYCGLVLLVKASLPILEARAEALIVDISSLSGLVPFPGKTAYSASKAAVRMLCEGLRLELKKKRVDVALIMPGTMRTPISENSPVHSDESKAGFRRLSEGRGFGLSPERAAEKILCALDRRRYRLVRGVDAWILDKVYRVALVWTGRFLHWATQFRSLSATS